MKCLLFAGAPNTGKSQSNYHLAKYLINDKGYNFKNPEEGFIEIDEQGKKTLNGKPIENIHNDKNPSKDVAGLLVNDSNTSKSILFHSYVDSDDCLNQLKKRIQKNKDAYLLITSIRNESDKMHEKTNELLKEMGIIDKIEIPLGKVVKGKNRDADVNWYLNSIHTLSKNLIDMLLFPSH